MIIEKKHYNYLVNQHGRVAHERGDFGTWKQAYEASIGSIYKNIYPALPRHCGSVLDIGSGLGGIDLHLAAHYGSSTHICLLDGDNNDPEVKWSFEPHNSMSVAFDFLRKNGVANVSSVAPGQLDTRQPKEFDLVVSFAAYGFHIHPGNYIDDLKKVTHSGTVIILEVRRTKEDWLRIFVEAFGTPTVLEREKKYVRVAFRVQP
jgi:hypothetical protein